MLQWEIAGNVLCYTSFFPSNLGGGRWGGGGGERGSQDKSGSGLESILYSSALLTGEVTCPGRCVLILGPSCHRL